MTLYKVESTIDLDELGYFIAEDLGGTLINDSFDLLQDDSGFLIAVIDDESGATCYYSGNADDLATYKLDFMQSSDTPCLDYETIFTIQGDIIIQELATT